jgi:hypothetical protein
VDVGTKCGTIDLAGLIEALARLTPEQRSALMALVNGMGG